MYQMFKWRYGGQVKGCEGWISPAGWPSVPSSNTNWENSWRVQHQHPEIMISPIVFHVFQSGVCSASEDYFFMYHEFDTMFPNKWRRNQLNIINTYPISHEGFFCNTLGVEKHKKGFHFPVTRVTLPRSFHREHSKRAAHLKDKGHFLRTIMSTF